MLQSAKKIVILNIKKRIDKSKLLWYNYRVNRNFVSGIFGGVECGRQSGFNWNYSRKS